MLISAFVSPFACFAVQFPGDPGHLCEQVQPAERDAWETQLASAGMFCIFESGRKQELMSLGHKQDAVIWTQWKRLARCNGDLGAKERGPLSMCLGMWWRLWVDMLGIKKQVLPEPGQVTGGALYCFYPYWSGSLHSCSLYVTLFMSGSACVWVQLSVCVCLLVCECVSRLCMCVCVCLWVCVCLHVCACLCVCLSVSECVFLRMCLHVCLSTCVCVCLRVCVCVCEGDGWGMRIPWPTDKQDVCDGWAFRILRRLFD